MLKKVVQKDEYSNCMYPFFYMPPNNNMIPVLEDLREADIRFFFKYDFDHKVMFFYYDPTRTKDAEKLLSKY